MSREVIVGSVTVCGALTLLALTQLLPFMAWGAVLAGWVGTLVVAIENAGDIKKLTAKLGGRDVDER